MYTTYHVHTTPKIFAFRTSVQENLKLQSDVPYHSVQKDKIQVVRNEYQFDKVVTEIETNKRGRRENQSHYSD